MNSHNVLDKSHKRNTAICHVVGPDLDIELCKSLSDGDMVMMEVNGGRYWTSQRNPMVVEEPWVVVRNDWVSGSVPAGNVLEASESTDGQLILSHSKCKSIVLSYNDLLTPPTGVAVFQTSNDKQSHKDLPKGILRVILQMVAYRLSNEQVDKQFPMPSDMDINAFGEALEDDRVKAGLLDDWVRYFSKVKKAGWKHNCAKRIAQRANVPLDVVMAFIDEDYAKLLTVSDEHLTRLRIECHWLPKLMKQSEYIQYDFEREFVK